MARDLGSKTIAQSSRVDHIIIDLAPDDTFNITIQRVREAYDGDKLISEVRADSQQLTDKDEPQLQAELVSILAKLAIISDQREIDKEAEAVAAAEAAVAVKP